MCSSAAWPSGSRTRWAAGSRGLRSSLPRGMRTVSRRRCPAGRWGCPSPGSTSGRTESSRRGPRGGSGSKPRSRGCSPQREGKDGSPRITAALRDDGWRVRENTVAALMREQGLAARREEAQGDDPAGQGPVAGTGPGQAQVRRGRDQPPLVRRRHRDRHRRGQAVPGLGAGHGLAPDRRVRARRPSRRGAGLRGAGHGGGRPRRGRARRGLPHRSGQRVHRGQLPGAPASGSASPSRWAGRARRWTTR